MRKPVTNHKPLSIALGTVKRPVLVTMFERHAYIRHIGLEMMYEPVQLPNPLNTAVYG
jgi:hypothetical protein